jgi:hypothetical protein
MNSRSLFSVLVLGIAVGCTSTRGASPVPAPTPISSTPEAAPSIAPNAGSWSFKYAPGSLSYQITRSAVIEKSDSLNQRESTTNATHERLVLGSTEQGIEFSAVIDTFSTTTQGLIGAVQLTELPVQISGLLATDSLTINSQPSAERCSPVSTVLNTDLHNLLVTFPAVLSAGMTWTDSVNIQGCQSGIPTLARITRSYKVAGEVMLEGKPAVLITRTDSSHARGEGGLQQHRLTINTTGTGTAAYYLNQTTGQISQIILGQTLDLGITTTGHEYRFKQTSKQEFRLVP